MIALRLSVAAAVLIAGGMAIAQTAKPSAPATTATLPVAPDNIQPFTQAAFDKAKADGKPILIEVTAPWCPTCRAQKPIIESLARKPDYAALQVFKVDFDSQADALKLFRAQQQSTLIAFRAGQEAGRSVGDTDPARIEALVKAAF